MRNWGVVPLLINGESIDDSIIRREAGILKERLIDEEAGDDPVEIEMRARELAKEKVIAAVLLRQAAFEGQTPLSPELADSLLQAFIDKMTAHVPRPRSSEADEYYKRFRNRFYTPELVHCAHIVKNVNEQVTEPAALEAITAAQRELEKRKSFEEVADAYSDCPGRGGDLGLFPRGQMVDEFEEVVFRLRPGEVSTIFRSPFGFHIAKLYERRAEGIRPLKEVRREIEEMLWERRRQGAVAEVVKELRAKADIRKLSGSERK